jgi:ABC-type transporter Mla subunit MlaD
MVDTIEEAAVVVLIVAGSLAALSFTAWLAWLWFQDDPFGFNDLFRG